MYEHLVGKTIAAVKERDLTARDMHYDDEYTITEVTLTFDDGSIQVFGLSNVEFFGDDMLELPDDVQLQEPTDLPAEVPDGQVALILQIDNSYELHEDVTTYAAVTVPVPAGNGVPPSEWWDDHIYPLVGVGHTDGDSWYDVTVLASSDPDLIPVGSEYEFGY